METGKNEVRQNLSLEERVVTLEEKLKGIESIMSILKIQYAGKPTFDYYEHVIYMDGEREYPAIILGLRIMADYDGVLDMPMLGWFYDIKFTKLPVEAELNHVHTSKLRKDDSPEP